MKVIIAGSRTITSFNKIVEAIKNSKFEITEIVSGNARGVDRLGEDYARDNKIPLRIFSANWNKYGKSAGYKRNLEMAQYADALIAIWDSKSKGTANMIETAVNLGLKVYVEII